MEDAGESYRVGGHDPHPHPHAHEAGDDGTGGERATVGFVGAGAVGTALGVAFARAGWPVTAIASRDPERRARFVRLVGAAAREAFEATAAGDDGPDGISPAPPRAAADPLGILEEAELIFLTVPDDAVAAVAGRIRLYAGQAIVHTSGLLGPEPLEPALAAGTQAGCFHPLVAFADTERAVAALHGATVALEGPDRLVALLGTLAAAIGATPVRLAPGSKAAYHAAAVLAAGGFVALLDAIAELGRVAGLDEAASLAIYGPLLEGTLANARALGIRAALTGPATRGDVGTLDAHLAELARRAPAVLPLYAAAAEREVDLAEARGAIGAEAATALRRSVAVALAKRP